jgi:hypothetical protein
MLTTEEREFYDVWFREDCGHTATYATPLAHSRGIGYNHFLELWPFYIETWKSIGGEDPWHDAFPPVPENPTPPCPWASKEEMEIRILSLQRSVQVRS